MGVRFTDRFTPNAAPPSDAPPGVLAWIELPSGNIYLQENHQWIDYKYPTRSASLNSCVRVLSPGPSTGSRLAFQCMFISAYFQNKYPVYRRVIEYYDEEGSIY